MQIVAVPLFDEAMSVNSYMIRYLKENNLFSTAQATSLFDGASYNEALEIVNEVGLDVFTLGLPLFIPIQDTMLLGSLHLSSKEPAEKIVLVFESVPNHEPIYLQKINALREKGYRFAINYPFDPSVHDPVIKAASYVFLSQREEKQGKTEQILQNLKLHYSNLEPIATHIYSKEMLQSLRGKGYALYESRFYKVYDSKDGQLPEAKAAAIEKINTVVDTEYPFEKVLESVKDNSALNVSLINIVNALYSNASEKIDTVEQAEKMIGQDEVRKWVVTALSYSFGEDRPSEAIRKSLIRAKFAENLAPLFNMPKESTHLYYLGLSSLLDILLGMPTEQALEKLRVSDALRDALLENKGDYAPVLKMITDYENANWSSVSRHMLMYDIKEDILSQAYIDALIWYRNLVLEQKAKAAI